MHGPTCERAAVEVVEHVGLHCGDAFHPQRQGFGRGRADTAIVGHAALAREFPASRVDRAIHCSRMAIGASGGFPGARVSRNRRLLRVEL